MESDNPQMWSPSPAHIQQTIVHKFMGRYGPSRTSFEDLWRWSVDELEAFWSAVWEFCGVQHQAPPSRTLAGRGIADARWFPGAKLNYAANLLAGADEHMAVIAHAEGKQRTALTRAELLAEVRRVQAGLRALGVGQGDRVSGLLTNGVEAIVAMLATTSLGAIWTVCSPDFGVRAVADRFGQVGPVVLFTVDGYAYGGKACDIRQNVQDLCEEVPSIEHVVYVGTLGNPPTVSCPMTPYKDFGADPGGELAAVPLAFDHPAFVLYTSGTTGAPKAVVHSGAGSLLKHLSEHQLHFDIRPGDVLFWFTTTGWMVWNWVASALASRATIVLYDGHPAHPEPDVLWSIAEAERVTHLGTSPKFLASQSAAGVRPGRDYDLGALRVILSSGAPLHPEQFDWVYTHVKQDVQLSSCSGGTEIVGCFVGGSPVLPVHRGEIQHRMLGMDVQSWSEDGSPSTGEAGELVCLSPSPSMPLKLWGDDGRRLSEAYLTRFPGAWAHGDLIRFTASGGSVIEGRSDTTLNRAGVRIGTAEIYRSLADVPSVEDVLAVGRPADGDIELLLFLVLAEGHELTPQLEMDIRHTVRRNASPRHVPERIFQVHAIPYTMSGKRVEKAVQQIMAGSGDVNEAGLADPSVLNEYRSLGAQISP